MIILTHPDKLGSIALRFIPWYFVEMPRRIIGRFFEYVRVVGEIFSFWFLVKTFFKLWKSITDKYPGRGFNIGLIAQAFTLNCTSRIIGMVFRLTALVIGIAMELMVLAIFLIILIVWFFFPVLFILDALYLIGSFS